MKGEGSEGRMTDKGWRQKERRRTLTEKEEEGKEVNVEEYPQPANF